MVAIGLFLLPVSYLFFGDERLMDWNERVGDGKYDIRNYNRDVGGYPLIYGWIIGLVFLTFIIFVFRWLRKVDNRRAETCPTIKGPTLRATALAGFWFVAGVIIALCLVRYGIETCRQVLAGAGNAYAVQDTDGGVSGNREALADFFGAVLLGGMFSFYTIKGNLTILRESFRTKRKKP
jgi:hypothetical protein